MNGCLEGTVAGYDANRLRDRFVHAAMSPSIFVDGVVPRGSGQERFLRQAREFLAERALDRDPRSLPPALLREALDRVVGIAAPSTKAGITTVGPRRARVWWDAAMLVRAGDILADPGAFRSVLRFYDITGLDAAGCRWNDSFDIDVELAANGKSVDFWAADRAYVVDVGLLDADGRFDCLARAGTMVLPRESVGNGDSGKTARSGYVPRASRNIHSPAVPSQCERQWVESRPDSPFRDIRAESVIHMLYRAFLLEGPRALRTAPSLVRRDARVLEREFAERARARSQVVVPVGASRAFLVARLDECVAQSPVALQYPVILARAAKMEPSPVVVRTGLVRRADAMEEGVLALAKPVFAAAANLRKRLDQLPSFRRAQARKASIPVNRLNLSEIKRLTVKEGVCIDHVTVMLEGRAKPGARLRVGGKLVRADANGRFRLECVVSGGKKTRNAN